MPAYIKGFLIVAGSSIGAFLFLLCASLWGGSPIQDLLLSAHAGVISQPSHQLTDEQLKSVMVLLKHQAVIPADVLLDTIVEFYTTLINQLIALIAVLGVVAYMYIRSSSKEESVAQASSFFESTQFDAALAKAVREKFHDSLGLYAQDYDSRLDSLMETITAQGKNISTLEKSVSERDTADSEGDSNEIEVPVEEE